MSDWLKAVRKNTFQAFNKASAVLGSPFMASPEFNSLTTEIDKIQQGSKDRGFIKPMGVVIYDPEKDKSNVIKNQQRQVIPQIPTEPGYKILIGHPKNNKSKTGGRRSMNIKRDECNNCDPES